MSLEHLKNEKKREEAEKKQGRKHLQKYCDLKRKLLMIMEYNKKKNVW